MESRLAQLNSKLKSKGVQAMKGRPVKGSLLEVKPRPGRAQLYAHNRSVNFNNNMKAIERIRERWVHWDSRKQSMSQQVLMVRQTRVWSLGLWQTLSTRQGAMRVMPKLSWRSGRALKTEDCCQMCTSTMLQHRLDMTLLRHS